jgi:hypothetical protein
MPTRCTAKTKAGTPCKAWAVRGSDPPRCAAHGGSLAGRQVGAPPGNQNAVTHGLYAAPEEPPATIEGIIADLARKQAALSVYIDGLLTAEADLDLDDVARLLKIHGMNASRLGRLLRDQRALSGDAADGIAGAIAQALDELSTELGVEL